MGIPSPLCRPSPIKVYSLALGRPSFIIHFLSVVVVVVVASTGLGYWGRRRGLLEKRTRRSIAFSAERQRETLR